MTPQKEAQRLVDLFKPLVYDADATRRETLDDARICAHIHLDELIKTLELHGALIGAVAYREVKDKIDSTI